jgi:hypothetical protein
VDRGAGRGRADRGSPAADRRGASRADAPAVTITGPDPARHSRPVTVAYAVSFANTNSGAADARPVADATVAGGSSATDDAYTDAYSDADACTGAYAWTDADACAYTDAGACTDAAACTDPDTDADADAESCTDACTEPDADTDAAAQSCTDADACTDAAADPEPAAERAATRRVHLRRATLDRHGAAGRRERADHGRCVTQRLQLDGSGRALMAHSRGRRWGG